MVLLLFNRDNEYVDANDTRCITCPPKTWPDEVTRKICMAIEPTYMVWTDPYGLTLSCLASAGIIASIIILVIVLLKKECRVIKVMVLIATNPVYEMFSIRRKYIRCNDISWAQF